MSRLDMRRSSPWTCVIVASGVNTYEPSDAAVDAIEALAKRNGLRIMFWEGDNRTGELRAFCEKEDAAKAVLSQLASFGGEKPP